MQEMASFEYAVIRVVPVVAREEFINIGVLLYCKGKRYLGIKMDLRENVLRLLCPQLDMALLKQYADAYQSVALGKKTCGSPIASLDTASRFRWLTAVRSTQIQTSRIHPGLCADPEKKLEQIFREQILPADC